MYNVYNENKSYNPEITDEIQLFYYILAGLATFGPLNYGYVPVALFCLYNPFPGPSVYLEGQPG